MILLGVYFIIKEIGCWCFLGIGIIFISIFLNAVISKKLIESRKETMQFTD